MTYEIAEKLVSLDKSNIFKNWNEYTGISKETFLEGIKWLCEEPIRYPEGHKWQGLLRRELGIKKNGELVHLRRHYGEGHICVFYEDKKLGSRFWGGHVSLSADDRI